MTQEEFFKRYSYSPSRDRIGGGGFGTVYKAYDNVLHHEVAIKVSEVKTTADGTKTFSLKDEFEALNHVPKHPNIANYEEFYSFEMPNGIFDYAVMQYYPDGNLTNAIKHGLTAEQKEDVATQLLEGIDFLHQHKVVHRDLKPGNILIVKYGGKIIPLITDFGLSKAAGVVDGSVFSNSFGAGTPKYSSPEQLQGKPLRFNTDLWSYGAILYELFTGEQLFSAGSGAANTTQADMEIYNKIVNGNVSSLGKMPEKWRKLAERCLVVDAEKRAKDAVELFSIIKGDVAADDETIIGDSPKPHIQPNPQTIPTEPSLPMEKKRHGFVTFLVGNALRKQEPKKEEPLVKDQLTPKTDNDKPKSKKLWIGLGVVAVVIVAILVMALPKSKQSALYVITGKDGKFGFIDKQGNVAIKPQFDMIDYHGKDNHGRRMNSYFVDEELVGIQLDEKWGFVDRNGNMVIYPQFDRIRPFFEGLAAVEKDDKWGFIDQNGRVIIIPQYENVGDFEDGLAWALTNDKYGVIDKKGNWIVRPVYDEVDYYCEGRAIVRIGDYDSGKRGFIDKSGKEVVIPKYDWVGDFSEGLAVVRIGDWKTGKRGFVDKSGNLIIDLKYDYADDFSEGLAVVELNGKRGYIDKTGKQVILPQFDNASEFSNGVAVIRINDKYGLVDKSGKQIVAPKYLDIRGDFSKETDGLAAVCLDYKWGFIDKKGNEVVRPHYDDYQFFSEGFAAVRIGDEQKGKWYFIDKTGKMLNEVEYDWAGYFSEGLALVGWKDGKYSYIDKSGNEIYSFYDDFYEDPLNPLTFEVNGVSFDMMKVEGGTFWMGAQNDDPKGRNYDRDAMDSEKPVHSVTVGSFYMGATEVTQALWEAVMGNNPSEFRGNNLPVENVSWNDCQDFIRKLNGLTGRRFRLPTAAEWEYAARGGLHSEGTKYSGGNTISEVAWYQNNSGGKTHEVATKTANELELYDMSGNVWEWCQKYNLLDGAPEVRGGCWSFTADGCRVSGIGWFVEDDKRPTLGFRLVLVSQYE